METVRRGLEQRTAGFRIARVEVCRHRAIASPADPSCFIAALEQCQVGEWRRRMRLFHAIRLLEGGASVTEVAFDCGYATASAFSQAYSRQFGHSPSKRRHRAGAQRPTPGASPADV